MLAPFTSQELNLAINGDQEMLAEFDKRGLILGQNESPQQYGDRLKVFSKNLQDVQKELKEKKTLTVENLSFPAQEIIPPETFHPAQKINKNLYDFSINWVPGFFVTPSFGLLFGGCAYSFAPEFFSLFIIRNSFKEKNKWLFYERDELISHELCHVARFALNSNKYEELFAYQTSTSNFRKKFGSMMRAAWETYLLMAILFGMLLTQISLIIFKGAWLASRTIWENPVNWFYFALFSLVAFLSLRQVKQNKSFAKTLEQFAKISPSPKALAFRLSDQELDIFVNMKEITPEKFKEVILKNSTPHRYELLSTRFLKNG